jgi:dihydroorotase-like cyclic amidohydrolase
MTVDTTIRNGQVVTPSGIVDGAVAIDNGSIVAIGLEVGLPPARRTIDAERGYVIPGFIDAHVHIGPGGVNWPPTAQDFYTESRAAAYGGVTTALVFLFSLQSYLRVFEDLVEWGEANSVIDFAFHAGINSYEQIAEIPALIKLGVTSFKHFYTANRRSGHGIIEAMDPASMFASFKTIAGEHGVAQVHCEDIDIIQLHESQVRTTGRKDLEAWSLARPPLSEALAIAHVAMIAKDVGAHGYIVHLSSAAGLDAVEQAQRVGTHLTAETCPQYLVLDQGMESEIGAWGKLIPPLRQKSDQTRLWEALNAGSVTTLGTDHVPIDFKTKHRGGNQFNDIWTVGLGIPNGMEHLLPVMLSAGVASGRLNMEQLVKIGSENTARTFGLYPKKGVLQAGADADIVIVDPNAVGRIERDFYHGIAHDWSPYFGFPLHGLPIMTMVRGEVVVHRRKPANGPARGRYLRRPYL